MLKDEINRLEKLAKLHDWNNQTDIALRELAECAIAVARTVETLEERIERLSTESLKERHMTHDHT